MARLMKWNPQRKIFREQVTYPRIKLTPENPEDDSCQNPSMPYEHVLQCGHLVITKKPDEQCAENCHHINELRKKGRDVQNSKKKWSTRTFYCDACEEAWIEKRIPLHISSTDAEERRTAMLQAQVYDHMTLDEFRRDFRKCDIALKVTSIPCDDEGNPVWQYQPREKHHPFDTALPQIGDNMFDHEDIDPPQEEAGSEDSNVDLGEEGADYLRYTRHLEEDEHNPEGDIPVANNGLTTRRSVTGKAGRDGVAGSKPRRAEQEVPYTSPGGASKRKRRVDERDYEAEEDNIRPSKQRRHGHKPRRTMGEPGRTGTGTGER